MEPTIIERAGFRLVGVQVWMDPETADYYPNGNKDETHLAIWIPLKARGGGER